mgnify:CR=1 FL=1
MRSRNLILFGVVTVLALGAAITATRLRAPAQQAEKPLLFPDLRARANDVGEIQVQGHDRTITLVRQGDNWSIREADGYPTLIDRVRDTVIGVAELRKLSDKTSNKKMFKRLGVEDLKESGSNSILLQLKDDKGAGLAALIVGRSRRSASRAESPALYVRLPDAGNALLVEGRLDVSTDPGKWFNRDLFDITPDRVQSLQIVHAEGSSVKMAREMKGADLLLADIPAGKEAQSSVQLSRMGTVLETFSMEGARAAGNVTLPADAATLTMRTFDGIVATLISARVDDKPMTRISFVYAAPPENQGVRVIEPDKTGIPDPGNDQSNDSDPLNPLIPETPPDVKGEVEKYNAAVKDWAFQVPQFKFDLLTRRMEDLVRDPLPKGESPIKLPE